jgi:acetolactate synthase small subunit
MEGEKPEMEINHFSVAPDTPIERTFVTYVEDKPGVLNRVASLFRRRNFNIESLTVGHTDQPGVSCMTIVTNVDEYTARRVEANLYKLVNVLRVEEVTHVPTVMRDLALIKVRADSETRTQVLQICDVFRARVELVRTGRVAMTRGPQSPTIHPEFVHARVPEDVVT